MGQQFYKGVSILESLAKVEHMVLWRDKGVGRLRLLYVSIISSYQSTVTGPLTLTPGPHRDSLVHSGAGETHMASPALSLRSGTMPHLGFPVVSAIPSLPWPGATMLEADEDEMAATWEQEQRK